MIYRRFGKTGLQMPVLSAGFMRSMHSWHQVAESEIPRTSQDNMEAIVNRALEVGINHFETARGYGSSEIQLGKVLREIPRKRFLLQTKIPPADNPAQFRRNFEDSLSRLGLARVDLLALHGMNDYRSLWQICRPNGCLHMARKIQGEGLAGHIGFSGHGPADVILQAVRQENGGGFDYVNLHWYYINQEKSRVLEAAAARDMGVFIISPTDKGGLLQKPPVKMQSLCQPLSPMQFNDLYCLGRPEIHTISIGAAAPGDFAEHLTALDKLASSRELITRIDDRLREEMARKTGHQRPEEMIDSFPSWDATPGYINIRYIVWLLNLARGWDLIEYATRQYRKLGIEVRWVPGNNAAHAGEVDLAALASKAGIDCDALTNLLQEAHDLFGSGPE